MPQGNWRWNSSSSSCKLSFLSSPHHQSALKSLFTGYRMCSYYMYLVPRVQVIEHSSDSIYIQSVEPHCNKGPRGWQNVSMILRFCYIKVILLLQGQKISFVIPRTLLYGGSLYCGSTGF